MNIEIDDENISVKDIMRQIKENVSKRNIQDDLLSKVSTKEFSANLAELEGHQYILNKIWTYSADYPIVSHRPFFGKFIVFTKKVIRKLLRWYINPIVEKQIEFNAFTVRAINSIVEELKAINAKNDQLEMKINKNKNDTDGSIIELLQSQINELKLFRDQVTSASSNEQQSNNEEIIMRLLEEYKAQQNAVLHEVVSPLKAKLEDITRGHEGKLNDLTHEFQGTKSEIARLQKTIRISVERLRRIERMLKDKNIEPEKVNNAVASVQRQLAEVIDFDYYLFEEYYRGTREDIKEKQKQYLRFFKKDDYVLDLGCGRGEFTELLLENGIKVTSVDLNDDMVSYCKERGFPIIQEDIISFLEKVEDNSVNGIFLGQVIEHLPSNVLIYLVNLAYKKLAPNGWFIAETPNPQCMSVFTQSFYMDMTHQKPVHAYTAKFILESAGFNEVMVEYFSPNDEYLRLNPIQLEGIHSDSLERFNQTIEHWNNTIFGYQDYYVAGRK